MNPEPAPTFPHPYPQLHLLMDELDTMVPHRAYDFSGADAEPSLLKGPAWIADPTGYLRQEMVPPPPHEVRTPAVIKYPRSVTKFIALSGVNVPELGLGFKCRAIVVQNVGTNAFLYCPELAMYLTIAATPLAVFNIPDGIEKVTLQWHTAVGNPVAPAAVAGQFATLWLYDEWVLPVSAGGGGGGSAAAGVITSSAAAQTNIAQNAASVQLLAANASRKDVSIFNDTAANLYVSFNGAASTANFKVQIAAGGYYSMQPGVTFTGVINGIWDAAGAGNARVTELT